MCPSFQMPRSEAVMRPSGDMAEASCMTSAAPPTARLPRCTRCQSLAKPSTEEYWHMGEMTMRCLRVMDRRVYGVKRRLMLLFGHYNGRVRYIVQRGDAIAGRASEK